MRRFPIIQQYDTMQCGIACLQMVCKYFGREYSLESLSHICFATTEGPLLFFPLQSFRLSFENIDCESVSPSAVSIMLNSY